MSSRILAVPEDLDWKKAYLAAVLERNRTRVPELIQHAREKITQRLHELWASDTGFCEEIEAIHDALYLLTALLSSLSYRHDAGMRSKWDEDN